MYTPFGTSVAHAHDGDAGMAPVPEAELAPNGGIPRVHRVVRRLQHHVEAGLRLRVAHLLRPVEPRIAREGRDVPAEGRLLVQDLEVRPAKLALDVRKHVVEVVVAI